MIDTRLSLAIATADGSVYRLGRDEPLAENVPLSLSFSSSIPGGFKDLAITIPREIARDWPDLGLFNDVSVYGPGGEVAWEGRIAQLPRSSGVEETIEIGAVGYAAHLRDDPSFTEVYVDSDLSHWGPAPVERVLDRASLNVPYGTDYEVKIGRSIHFSELTDKSIQNSSTVEAWYLCPPAVTLASADYLGSETLGANNAAASIRTGSNLDGTTGVSDNAITLNSSLNHKTLTNERYAYVRLSSSAIHNAATARSRTFKKLAVFGNHGLTLYSPDDTSDPQGVYASDVILDVLARAAPLLNANVTPTSFAIPQLAFPEPTTAAEVVSVVNAYHLFEWGVYEGREFFYRPPDPSRTCWEARLADGAQVSLEGDAGDEVFNGVLVRYTNPNGIPKTAGPIGAGTDAEDESLQDLSPTNPVNAHGIPRLWGGLDVSVVTTQAGAIQLGAAWLAAQALPQRRGSLVVQGTIRHPTAGMRPVWAVRAGDYVKLADHSADVARRIIEVSYDHASKTATLSLENVSHSLDAFLERVAVLTGAV